jgi:hypothetical protein
MTAFRFTRKEVVLDNHEFKNNGYANSCKIEIVVIFRKNGKVLQCHG